MRDLTPEELAALLRRLAQEGVGYVELHRRLTRYFEWRECGVAAEELADETLGRLARRLAQRFDVPNLYGFTYGVARNVRQEHLRPPRHEEPIADDYPDPAPLPEPSGREEEPEDRKLECMRTCFARLPEDQLRLILGYYPPEGNRILARQKLAEELGIASNALRIRAHRIRRALEKCFRDCLE